MIPLLPPQGSRPTGTSPSVRPSLLDDAFPYCLRSVSLLAYDFSLYFYIFRRLLMSQNRHEVYFNCASFSEKYVQYITNQPRRRRPAPRPTSEDDFLTINEYGPFNMKSSSNVEKFHVHLLALIIKHGNIDLPPRKVDKSEP